MSAAATSLPGVTAAAQQVLRAVEESEAERPLDLTRLVDEVITTTDEADPDALAALVMDRLGPADLRAAVGQMLRGFVRERLVRLRLGKVPSGDRERQKSWKRDTIRERAEQMLAQRVHAGRDDQGRERWLLLGDCTRDDLVVMVTERRALAAATLAKAEAYERLAEVLERNGGRTVRDLPAQTLLSTLGGAA